MDFLPANYETPQGAGSYMKFQQGDNKFRILSKPIIGWLDWKDKVPYRFGFKNKPEKPLGDQPIRHFWAMIVFDYSDQAVKILEITQSTIQKSIEHLAKDEDWGSPHEYDLKVNKTGQDKSTEYKVNPSPKKPVSDEIKAAALAKPINLEALYKNGDPFNISNGEQTALIFQDLPF
jgi:hypothetical protein